MSVGSTTGTTKLEDVFAKVLDEGLKQIVGEAFDKAVADAVAEAELKRDEYIAKTVVRLRSWTRYEDMGRQFVITIEKPLS